MIISPSTPSGIAYSNPVGTASIKTFGGLTNAWGCAVGGTGNNRLFVSNNTAPVRVNVFDTSDPANPAKIGDVYGAGYGIGIGASQDFIAVPDYGSGTKIFNANTLAAVTTLGTQSVTTKFMGSSFSDDGSMYAQHSDSYGTTLWRTSDWSLIRSYTNTGGSGPTVFNPDGNSFYVYPDSTANVFRLDTASNTILATSQGLGIAAVRNDLAVSPDGTKIYAKASTGTIICVFNANTLAITNTLELTNAIYGIACSPDGSTVYATLNVGSNRGRALDASTLAAKFSYESGTFDVAVSGSGAAVYSIQTDGNLHVLA